MTLGSRFLIHLLLASCILLLSFAAARKAANNEGWYPQRELNPHRRRERAES